MSSKPPHGAPLRHGRTEKAILGMAVVVVLVVSVALTIRRGDLGAARAEPKRFSGSMVVLPMRPLLAPPRLEQRERVVVVRDDAAASFFDSPATLDSTVEAWRVALTNIGADVRVVRSAQLASSADWASVLVVPSSPCLTVATREAIEAASARGQGLIVAGATGALDAACRQIGYGLVVALTTASRVQPLESRPMVYVTMIAGSPLTDDLPPGARLDLKPAGQLALRHPARDAYYSDYELQPAPADKQPLLDGALSHGMYGKARVVYWGFELRDAVARPWNDAVLGLLVRNSVRWAAGQSSVTIEPWPDARRAAAVLAQDVEDHFSNARYALDSLRAANVRGTFFLTSDLALRNARLAAELGEEGEVGSHSENHRLLGGTPTDAQRQRLDKTQHDLTALFGNGVRGLRPPQEQFDAATMAGWLTAGGTYMVGANDSRSVGPELLPVGADTLVLLSRNGGDDFTAVREGHRDPAATATVFLRDYQRIRALGGLYILSYHSQLLSSPELVPALARVARVISTDTLVWPTTAGAVATWWRSRADLDVRLKPRGPSGLDVIIQNRGSELVLGAVAQVRMEQPRRVVHTTTAQLASDPGIVRVRLPPLPPKETRVVSVTFATPTVARSTSKAPATTRHRKATRARRDNARPPWWAPWRW